MRELISRALNHAGYIDTEPTEENITNCFLDYVDAGIWHNLDFDEAREDIADGEITVKDMCHAILKL
jgi:hypothetical protein